MVDGSCAALARDPGCPTDGCSGAQRLVPEQQPVSGAFLVVQCDGCGWMSSAAPSLLDPLPPSGAPSDRTPF